MTIDPSSAGSSATFDALLGESVHQVLWRRKIRQTEFARKELGITQSAFSRKLRGERPFSAQEMAIVADALQLDLNELIPHGTSQPGPGDDDGAAGGAPTRARTWDLRIISPILGLDVTDSAA